MKSPFFILVGNGSYSNLGCEAIVRGTVKIIRKYFKNHEFKVFSYFNSEESYDYQKNKEYDKSIEHIRLIDPFCGQASALSRIKRFMIKRIPVARREEIYKTLLPYVDQAKAILSIGGDNYSLDYGNLEYFTDLDDFIFSRKRKIIIWGASVGPFSKHHKLEKLMTRHFNEKSIIFARESYTLNYLNQIGVYKNIYDVADPAFVMGPKMPKDEMPFYNLQNTIGLNLSPLLGRYLFKNDYREWIKQARRILLKIKNDIKMPILLIPHVCEKNFENNDYLFMKTILPDEPFEGIQILPPIYSSEEIKWIISKLFLFIGARTHATIAALSSCVPTISLAYSIKALGINNDIFGNHEFCLKPEDLSPSRISDDIKKIIKNHHLIKERLNMRIPQIFSKAEGSGELLRNILQM